MLILFLPQLFYSMHIFVNKPAYLLEDYITAIGMAGGIGLCIKEAVLSFYRESIHTFGIH